MAIPPEDSKPRTASDPASPGAVPPAAAASDRTKVAAARESKPAAEDKAALAPDKPARDKPHAWYDDWVGKLAGDGSEIPSVVLLFGYLSHAPQQGRIRLYFDAQLMQGIELAADEIVHREAAQKTFSPLGGSFVWIPTQVWAEATLLWRQI